VEKLHSHVVVYTCITGVILQSVHLQAQVTLASLGRFFFLVVKGPAADATTDAPQPSGFLCNPLVKITMMMIIIFYSFPSDGAPVEWNWHVKTEVLAEKPAPVPLCPPQIPHGLTWDRTRASAVGGRWLTAWAMARPLGWCHKSAECAKPCARRSVCFCSQSGGGASVVCLRSSCNHVTEIGGP
jgi:hypothetical protein